MRLLLKGLLTTLLCLFVATAALAQDCVTCHKQTTPNIVSGWELSKHSQNKIDCTMCHGDDHKSAQDFAKAKIPTPDTCAMCHEARVKQFKA